MVTISSAGLRAASESELLAEVARRNLSTSNLDNMSDLGLADALVSRMRRTEFDLPTLVALVALRITQHHVRALDKDDPHTAEDGSVIATATDAGYLADQADIYLENMDFAASVQYALRKQAVVFAGPDSRMHAVYRQVNA